MNYTSYKKNELIKLKLSDIDLPLPDLKNTNKSQVIADWLMIWLDSKNLDGYLLPSKAEFAYSFGVSLGTVQNVFKILETKNYIFLKQKIGAIVSKANNKIIRKQTSKSDIGYNKIKEFIRSSDMKIGESFPSNRQLSQITDISLSTIRVSINRLLTEGILKIENNRVMLNCLDFEVEKNVYSETLVDKTKQDLKQYIIQNFKVGEKLPANIELAKRFDVSIKTIHNAIKMLEKDGMVLCKRGAYGTIVTNTSQNPQFEPKREMSIFASAQETAFYHYQKTQNKIKKIILDNYGIGSKLPSIREFSQELDLSPNTVRKALNKLAQEGIIRFARGRYGGTFVIDMPNIEEQTFRWLAVNPSYVNSSIE